MTSKSKLSFILVFFLNFHKMLRNPNHQARPSFNEISSRYLQQSSPQLLYWSSEDNDLSPSVGVLGTHLEEAFELHLDLQEKYKFTKFCIQPKF